MASRKKFNYVQKNLNTRLFPVSIPYQLLAATMKERA